MKKMMFISLVVGFLMSFFLKIIENTALGLLCYFISYSLVFLSLLIKKKFNLLSVPIMFSLFFSVFIGLCPVFLWIQYLFVPSKSDLVNDILQSGTFLSNHCFWIMMCFVIFVCTIIIPKGIIKNQKQTTKLTYSKLVYISVFAISSAFEVLYLIKNWSVLFSGDLENGRVLAMQGNGIYLYSIWAGTFAIAIMFEDMLRGRLNKKIFWMLFLIHVISLMFIGFRSRIITLFIIMIFVFNKYKKINAKKKFILGGTMFVTVMAMDLIRGLLSNAEGLNLTNVIIKSLANGSINMEYIYNCFPRKIDFQKGYTYIINFKMILPGPDKDFTLWLKDAVGISYSGGGLTPTLVGEAYLNFGKIGMCFAFAFTGVVVNLLDELYEKSANVYFVSFIIWIILSSVRGGYSNSLINFVLFGIMNVCVYLFSKYFINKEGCNNG